MAAVIVAQDIAIDVSHWQGTIDWPAVADAGICIAMIKASEGAASRDRNFTANRTGAERAGILAIPYHFLTPEPAAEQAANFRAATDLDTGMAFALDWEGRASTTAPPETAEAVGEALALDAGRKPLGYWGIPGSSPALPTAKMLDWPRWVPRYPRAGVACWDELPDSVRLDPVQWWRPDDTGRLIDYLHFAQYTAWGRVPGIAGPCDRSVAFFASAEDALAWWGRPAGAMA